MGAGGGRWGGGGGGWGGAGGGGGAGAGGGAGGAGGGGGVLGRGVRVGHFRRVGGGTCRGVGEEDPVGRDKLAKRGQACADGDLPDARLVPGEGKDKPGVPPSYDAIELATAPVTSVMSAHEGTEQKQGD